MPTPSPSVYSITLLYPNGGEHWEADQTYTVQWSTPNYTVSNFEVHLYSVDSYGNLTPTNIVVGPAYITPDLRSFSWKVPYSLFGTVSPTTATRYKLRITLLTNGYTTNADKYYDYSDGGFSITGASAISTPNPTPIPTPTASTSFDFNRDLYFGLKGDDVKHLQVFLVREVNYSANLITGYFGRITRDAVIRFQEKYGVKPVSGYFGEITRRALNAVISN